MNRIVLASESIGRRELFDKYIKDYDVHVSALDESVFSHMPPLEMVVELAKAKASEVAKLYPDDYVCGFDTVVLCDGDVLGKPPTKEDAKAVLRAISGKKQSVISGFAITNRSLGIMESGIGETMLFLHKMSDEYIDEYVANHPVTRFAGGYGVQDNDKLCEVLSGEFDTVIGAPMQMVLACLRKLGAVKEGDVYEIPAHGRPSSN